jgi:hypothetical protein
MMSLWMLHLELTNFYMQNAPIGASIANVTYLTPTTATFEIAFDGSDFDTDVTNMMLGMAASEAASGNPYLSNALTITANDDAEEIMFVGAQNVMEGDEDGQTFTVEISGGNFINPLTTIGWSFSFLPEGVTIGSVNFISETSAEVVLNGNATVDYDTDETVTVTIAGSEYNDGSTDIATTNSFMFEAYVEMLTTAIDTIPESEVNTVNIPFVLQDDYLTNLTPDLSDFVLQNAPTGLEIESVNVIDET